MAFASALHLLCTGSCLSAWIPLRTGKSTKLTAGKGVKDAVIANNAFNEGGTAVDVAEGSSGIKVTNNRFLDVARKVFNNHLIDARSML